MSTDNMDVCRRTEGGSCNFCDDRTPRTVTEFKQRQGYGCVLCARICDACLAELTTKVERLRWTPRKEPAR